MKVWRDYRVTMRAKIRRELGLHPGTVVEFLDPGDRIEIVKSTGKVEEVIDKTSFATSGEARQRQPNGSGLSEQVTTGRSFG